MESAAAELRRGGIVVIPTDTVYGIVAKAQNRNAVLRLCRMRRRSAKKPFIVLVGDMYDIREFGVRVTAAQRRFLKKVWPGKVSVIFCCPEKRFAYLHRGTNTLAFRMPRSQPLRALLKKTGPLVAPSANPEREKPAQTISEARRYFGKQVDFYIGAGRRLCGKPSTVVSFKGSEPRIIREGEASAKVRRALSDCGKSLKE